MGGNVIQGERLCLSQLLSTQHRTTCKKNIKTMTFASSALCMSTLQPPWWFRPSPRIHTASVPNVIANPPELSQLALFCPFCVFVTNSTNVDLQFINHNILFVIRLTSHHSSQFSHNPQYYRNCNNWESITGTSLLWSLSLPLCRNENKNLTRVGAHLSFDS